jgi:thiamine biosynthesis lipoprotein
MRHRQDRKPKPSIFRACRHAASLTLITIASVILGLAPGCKSNTGRAASPQQRFEFSQAQMGLDFRITIFAANESMATTAVSAAYRRIAELNSILSDYDSDSEISRLSLTSGSDRWIPVGEDLWTILNAAQKLAKESDGAFDLTIGPSVNLWRRARRQKKMPDEYLLQLMKDRVGYHFLQLDSSAHAARLTKPDMRLDAGGIAKGYAMDEAMNVLNTHRMTCAMIQGGGDMVLGEPPPGKTGWLIQLTESNSPALLLSNCALATSGDLYQNLEIGGVRYSHIVDPRTGIGLTNRCLVHVIAPNGITADSFSTTLNILGPEEALELLRRHPDVQARIANEQDGERTTVETTEFADSVYEQPASQATKSP